MRREPGHGHEILHDPLRNKGTAFSHEERDALGLHGLLPPHVLTQEEQEMRILENFDRKPTDLDKYVFLADLQDRNERLFCRTLLDHIERMMPIVYTPTVGEACSRFAHIFRRSRGLWISADDRGRVEEILRNWPGEHVAVIVVTDGERILGLGDLGANGMGIPIGKLVLYTVCAGIDPADCLPVLLDVGTNNEELRNDPLYLGLVRERLPREEYDELVEEFVTAVSRVFPEALLQFEDFHNRNAFRLLAKYRDRLPSFNDDIQGTAAVVLGGLLAALRERAAPWETSERILFFGAGAAATGIADLFVQEMVSRGGVEREARESCWFVDSKGLVVAARDDLQDHKRRYAHEHEPFRDLLEAVRELRPSVLVGASGQPGAFTTGVLEEMARNHERPIVFALSNPTSKAECTAEEAYRATQGRAIFASGSPFDPVELDGRVLRPSQGNNAYVFPGIGLGVTACRASRVTDEMILAAARAVGDSASPAERDLGLLFPPLTRIRDVSASVASAVARAARECGVARAPLADESPRAMRRLMFEPAYN